MRYKAFISYSHAADDRLAATLESALHRFAKPWLQLRKNLAVFRDKSSLTPNPHLWPTIELSLKDSEYFLLLASPLAAGSHWVQKEVRCWLESGREENLIIVLTDGAIAWDNDGNDFDWERTNALPASMRGKFPNEPLYADLSWAKARTDLSLNNPRFREVVAEVAAVLHGRPKDTLVGFDVEQRTKIRRGLSLTAAVLILLTITSVVFFFRARSEARLARDNATRAERNAAEAKRNADQAKHNETRAEAAAEEARRQAAIAEERRRQALGRQLAAEAEAFRAQRAGLERSALLAVEAARRLPQAVETDQVMRRALAILPKERRSHSEGTPLNYAGLGADGSVAVVESPLAVQVWDLSGDFKVTDLRDPGRITNHAISADGKRIALGSGDSVRIWQSDGRTWTKVDVSVRGRPSGMAFSPDTRYLAVATHDSPLLAIWDAATRETVNLEFPDKIRGLSGGINSPVFSADGKLLAVGRRQQIGIWQAGQWKENPAVLEMGSRGEVRSVAFSPDGRFLAAGANSVRIWEAPRWEPLVEMATPPGGAQRLVFSESGLACANREGYVRLWSLLGVAVHSGGPQELATLHHEGEITGLAFSADGAYLASASADRTASIWSTADGSELGRMTHDTGVAAMSFAVSRAALTTMSSGGIVHDWDPAGRLEVASARVSGSVQSLAFTKGSQYLIATDDNGPAKVQKIGGAGPSKPAEACAVVEGREGLSTSETSAAGVLVRNWRTGASFALEVDAPAAVPRSYRERPPSGCTANRQVFSPDGSHLAVRQSSGRLFVWNLRNQGRRDYTTPADLRDVFAFGPDGRVLALAAAPQEVRLVDADSGSEKARWTLDEPVETLTFTSEGRHLAIASRRAIQIFDTRTHAALGRIAREGWEFEPRFSPDGRYLATDGGHNSDAVDRRVIAQGAILTRLPDGRHVADLSHSGSEVNVVAFSADSTMVATGGSDNTVHLWRTSDGKEIAAWTVGRRVGAVAFSPDGTLLAAGGEDQLARVWSVASFGEVARLDHASTVYGLAFSADNRFLATAARIAPQGEDQAHVFYLRPEDTAREICGRITRGLTSREWSESLAGEKFEATCKREAKK